MSRIEHDLLGKRDVPKEALYGIHTLRAIENFPVSNRPIAPPLIHAFGDVKLACARTNVELGFLNDTQFEAIEKACIELQNGELDNHIVVDALQGGAGTSTNMNVNEVLANRALQLLGEPLGSYDIIHPLEHINLHQSTNDTYPTALNIAAIKEIRNLEQAIITLLEAFQAKEKEFQHIVKIGRTQLQDAVLTTLGRSMSAYADVFSRDRWRIYKCEERLRMINLGGTAIGTGLTAPRKYIFKVSQHLKTITGLGVARAENMIDVTQNNDAIVEVSGILSALASSLMKVANDLRLLSSGPHAGLGEINLPERQAGSSIMPGKVNPVIPEMVVQVALKVMSNHNTITHTAGLSCLELNPFTPLLADSLLDSIALLKNGCRIFAEKCIMGITANEEKCKEHIETSTATITALIEEIGYEKATEILKNNRDVPIKELLLRENILTNEQFDNLTSPESVTKLGS